MLNLRRVSIASISACLLSFALLSLAGCNRDPNVRKQKYLASAKRLEAEGKSKEATIQLLNALKIDKGFAPAHYELAKVYLKTGSLMPAVSELLKALDNDPKYVDAHITYGYLLLGDDEPEPAETQAKLALEVDPRNADAYALLAGVARVENNQDDALKYTQQAIALAPNRAEFHSALALLEARKPDGEASAMDELRKAASLDPTSATPHILLAELLEKNNDMQGAEQQFQAAISADPHDLSARQKLAGLYTHVGNQAQAEQTLQQAVEAMPDDQNSSSALAQYYAQIGQPGRAETALANLSSKYPKSFGIKITYADVLFDHKNYAQSESVLSHLSKIDAARPEAQALNAQILLNTGKVDEAVALLKQSVKANPTSVGTLLLLAHAAETKGDRSTAEVAYRQAAKLNPGSVEALTGLANIAIARNDANMLTDIAAREIRVHPNYVNGYLWRATAEAGEQHFDLAEADLQALIKGAPDNAQAYMQLGQLRVGEHRAKEAKPLFEKALEKDPSMNLALSMLLAYDIQAKQWPQAIARVQAQIARVPGNSDLYDQLAVLQSATGDNKSAVESATKAMQLDPTNVGAMETYSKAEIALGGTDAAIALWQNWAAGHTYDYHALDVLGSIEETKGDQLAAMEYYKKALNLNSMDAVASNNLALLMLEDSENVDVALSLAETARRALPHSPQTADTLAWVYFSKGDYSEARELLEDTLKTTSGSAIMHYHLGMIDLKMEDTSDGQAELKKAVALDPKSKAGLKAAHELNKMG